MLKKVLFLIFIPLSLLVSCSSRETGIRENKANVEIVQPIGPKKKVAVVEFTVEPVYGKRRLGNASSSILISDLQSTGRFIIVERERLSSIIDEQKLSLTGMEDTSTAVSVGTLAGADAIITGSVTKFGVNITSSEVIIGSSKVQTASAEVNVRLIDVSTGTVVLAQTGEGKAEKSYSSFLGIGSTGGYDEALEGDALNAAIQDVVDKIVISLDKIPWSCRIAKKVNQETVIIDAGQGSNLAVGTILKVFRRGEAVISPGTGEIIGYSEESTGSLEVTAFFGENGSYCKIISDNGMKEGNLCRLK